MRVDFVDKGDSKSAVIVAHERIADADAAQVAKILWREKLAGLKSLLEA